jgi:hypothetical protein
MSRGKQHIPTTLDDQKILTFQQWCKLISVSPATGNRILRSGDGPKVIQLTERRFGIRVADNARWLEQRVRS